MRWGVLAVLLARCASPAALRAAEAIASAEPRRGNLRVSCNPPDATVWLDGMVLGSCAELEESGFVQAGAGMHRVEVKKEGYLPYLTYVEPRGARASLAVELRPATPIEGVNR